MKITVSQAKRKRNGVRVYVATVTLTAEDYDQLRNSDIATEMLPDGKPVVREVIRDAIEHQLTEDMAGRMGGGW